VDPPRMRQFCYCPWARRLCRRRGTLPLPS
jgi:hypothetical protein